MQEASETNGGGVKTRRKAVHAGMRFAAWAGFWLAVLALVTVNAALIWVATGPRSLERAIPYIEKSLNASGKYQVKVREGVLTWDGWQHPLDIRLKKVDIFTAEGIPFASFPEVSLGISLRSLAVGRVEPTSISVRHSAIVLNQSEDGKITFGFPHKNAEESEAAEAHEMQDSANQGAALAVFFQSFFESGGESVALRRLRRIEVENARVTLIDYAHRKVLNAEAVKLSLSRRRGRLLLVFSAALPNEAGEGLRSAGEVASAKIHFEANVRRRTREGTALLRLQGLNPALLAPLAISMPEVAEALKTADLPFSGFVNAEIASGFTFGKAQLVLQGGAGMIRHALLAEEMPVAQVQLKATLTPQDFHAEQFLIDFGAAKAQGNAQYTQTSQGVALNADVDLTGAAVADVARFWPPSLAPMSREWVVKSVTAGQVPQASLIFRARPGDFEKPVLPREAVDARIRFTGASVRYLPDHPEIRDAVGTVHVDGESLEVKFEQAAYGEGTRIGNGAVLIEELNADNPEIRIQAAAAARASDVAKFLSLPPANVASRLSLNPAEVEGALKGTVDLSFYYFAPRDENGKPRDDMGISYNVRAEMEGIAQKNFLGKFDISGGGGTISATSSQVEYKGNATVNGVPAAIEARYLTVAQGGFDTFLNVNAPRAPLSAFKKFGYPEIPQSGGAVGVKASLKQGQGREEAEVTLDLTAASLGWKEMRWDKPAGAPATLRFSTRQSEAGLEIPAFDFSAGETQAKGSAALAPGLSALRFIKLDRLRLQENDLALEYAPIAGGYRIAARGAVADVSPWMSGGGNDFTFSKLPALDVTLDVKHLVLAPERELDNVRGRIQCAAICTNVDVAGVAGEKPFSFRIGGERGGRTLEAQAGNAGALLRALSVYDTMKGGTMRLSGRYNDSAPGNPLSATLLMNDYVVEDAPVLARLLTLASLTGFVDTLQGKGIAFAKFSAPFTLANDVITLKDVKTYGPAMGLFTEGTIRFPGQVLDLNGTIVPSYTINNVLGNVPILGDILTGGGEGVFAARFSVSGPAANPDVSVNPLSILTPGFLRGLFDIFEGGSVEKKE